MKGGPSSGVAWPGRVQPRRVAAFAKRRVARRGLAESVAHGRQQQRTEQQRVADGGGGGAVAEVALAEAHVPLEAALSADRSQRAPLLAVRRRPLHAEPLGLQDRLALLRLHRLAAPAARTGTLLELALQPRQRRVLVERVLAWRPTSRSPFPPSVESPGRSGWPEVN